MKSLGKGMEGRFRLVSFLLLVLVLLILGPFHDNLASAKRSTYVVHMDKSVMPRAFISHHQWYSSILHSIKTNSNSVDTHDQIMGAQHVYTYENVMHGFSALLSEEELESLKKSPGFLLAYKDGLAQMHTTHSPDFLSLNQAAGLWPASHYGEDVIVGVIDSGTWPESPSFRDDGMTAIPSRWKGACEAGEDFNSSNCNLKLIGARNFNKGYIAKYPNITWTLMNSTRDILGHGTHTSSTVAGNYVAGASFFGYAMGTARVIAPRARLAMYKVGPYSVITFSDVLAGMDQAVSDGVDIISISIGEKPRKIYHDLIAIASFGAMEKGILVSCSAGNRGPSLGSAQNGIPWAMTVAASSMDRSFGGLLTLGNGLTIIGWSVYPVPTIVEDLPLIYNKSISACNSSDLLTVKGIVICDHFNMESQYPIIANSTVAAFIFFTDKSRIFDYGIFPFASVFISKKYKKTLLNYAINDGRPSASIRFNQTFLGRKPAPAVADYSSRGPAPRFPNILKPDVMAPGTLILAASIPNDPVLVIGENTYLYSGFKFLSGTSMACPHASGIAALLKGAHPEWSPAAIRSAMMTTANTLDNTGNPIKDIGFNYEIASPLAMGAGQVNPNGALDPGLVYDATTQDYINLLCSMNLTHRQISAITRSTNYDCSNPSSDLNYPSFIALYKKGSTTVLSKTFKRTVTNVGNGGAKYKARVIPPKGSIIDVSPRELSFHDYHEKQSYSLTIQYAGDAERTVSFGSLTWIEVGGKHTVKSPIVISPIIKKTL